MTRRARALVLVASVVATLALAPASSALAAANFTWKPLGKVKNLGEGSLDALECPTTTLCVAGGSHAIWVTANVTAQAAQWKRVAVSKRHATLGESYIQEVTCPTATFCAVGDSNSNVLTSTSPSTPNPAVWGALTAPYTGVYAGIGGLACSSPNLCAMNDSNYALSTTTMPMNNMWTSFASSKPSGTGIGDGIKDVACADKTCVAVFASKDIWVTSDASVQPAKWRKLRIARGSQDIWSVACKTANLCMAGGAFAPLRVTTNATSGNASTWKAMPASMGSVTHVNCTKDMCMVTNNVDVWWSPTPQVARSWKKSPSGSRTILSDIACPTPKLCVASNVGGQLFVGRR